MKPKTMDEGPQAAKRFSKAMTALFQVPKGNLKEEKSTKPKRGPKPKWG